MRDFLTGLAIILIVILTTVLVAPYFVDWNSQRGFLEARLTHALGEKVTIGGNIDLKILPTPYLVLDQVVVGGDDGPIKIGIRHLDLELTVTPLFHGEFDIVEARLEEPTIRVGLEADRTLPALPAAPAFQADVRFDRIRVSDGTLAIADPASGRTFVLDHLDLDADAESLAGPFKVNGSEGPDDRRTKFHLATLAAENGHARTRLVVEETPAHAGFELEGVVDFAGAGHETVRQTFDGSLVVSGHAEPTDDTPIAWKLSGPFKMDPRQARLDGGELRLGNEDAGLTLQATAAVDLGDVPKLALALTAKQLDIDRLSGAPVDSGKPPPPKLPDLAGLRRMAAAIRPPLLTALDLSVDNATYGGETLEGLKAQVVFGGKGSQPIKLFGDGPGGSHVAIDGHLDSGAAFAFAGSVDLEADNLPRVVDWLSAVAPSLPWKAGDIPFRSVKLEGPLNAHPDAIDSDKLAITLDRSALDGRVGLAFGDGRRPAKLTAMLESAALDLDGLPSLDTIRGGSEAFDLDLHLDAKAIKVSQIGDGALQAGRIRLALAKTGRHVDLTDFHADDLGGATIQAKGSLDPDHGMVALTLDAARLDAAAALLRQLVPGAVAETLVARAAALAPAKLKIDAALSPRADGTLAPTQLSVIGQLGQTRVDASTKPDTTEPGATSVAASLQAPDGGALLSQLGVPSLPMAVIGASRISLSARGKAGEPLDTTVTAAFGATRLTIDGRFDILSGAPDGSGRLQLRSADLTPLMQSLAIAFPDMTGSIAADIGGALALSGRDATLSDLTGRVGSLRTSGTLTYRHAAGTQPALAGTLAIDRLTLASLVGLSLGPPQAASAGAIWSQQPFAVGLIDPPACAVTLTAKTLEIIPGLDAQDGQLELGIAANVVTLGKVRADLSGGRIDGRVTLRRDGKQATVEGAVALKGVDIRTTAFEARVDGTLDIAGGGTSSLGLVTSLAGSGQVTAADLRIPGADPSALPRVFQDVETDALSVDQDAVTRAFEDAAKAPLTAGTRRFSLGLAAGVLHLEPKGTEPAADASVTSKIDASFDLTRSRLETHIGETLNALPKNWSGPPPTIVMTQAGPLDAPVRSYDVSAFLDAVAARALARETARIEAYELDIRERALFNARLQSEQRREEERQRAEDDARRAAEAQAEADRKARLEVARQERLRRDQAAKAARDEAEKAARDKANQTPKPPSDARPPSSPAQPSRAAPDPPTANDPADPSTLGRY